MLKYEWRKPIADEDAILTPGLINNPLTVPEPVVHLTDPGPNPFVPIDEDDLPGAEKNEITQPNDQQEQGVDNQGGNVPRSLNLSFIQLSARQVEAQDEDLGANDDAQQHQDVVNENEDDDGADFLDNGAPETDTDVPDAEDDMDVLDAEVEGEEIEKEKRSNQNRSEQRRGNHCSTNEGEDFGRGKRAKRSSTRNTHLLERHTTGLAFVQMSAKQGIKKYSKEAEMKMIAEFAQILEYQVFHGMKSDGPDGITLGEKKGAGDMINLIEEKINRGHSEENPVL
ncbi:MAG: hypothetical protein SGBAC_009480 [Bacillariaceae sp.]